MPAGEGKIAPVVPVLAAHVLVSVTADPLEALLSEAFPFSGEPMSDDPAVEDWGAVVQFTGHCRSEGGRLAALELEHYPGMAEARIRAIAEEACQRFGVAFLAVHHRYGIVRPQEVIVVVRAASRHRDAAFDACRMVMDYLKTDAPFWKKTHPVDGTAGEWVGARTTDDVARASWDLEGDLEVDRADDKSADG